TVPVDITAQDVSKDIVLVASESPLAKKATLTLRVVERVKSGDKTIDKAIAGAEIVISQKDKRIRAEKCSQDGKLAAPLPAGIYTVVVTKPGFKSVNIPVYVSGQDAKLDIVLEALSLSKTPILNLRVVERLKSGEKTIDKAIPGADIVISQKDK